MRNGKIQFVVSCRKILKMTTKIFRKPNKKIQRRIIIQTIKMKTVTAIIEMQLKPIIDKKLCLVKELTEEEIY
jgi:hypothetical protein